MLNNNKVNPQEFKHYLTTIAFKNRGKEHYTPRSADSYISAIYRVGINTKRNLWECDNAQKIRNLLEDVYNTDWFRKGNTHGLWSSGMKCYAEYLDYLESSVLQNQKEFIDESVIVKKEIVSNKKIQKFKDYLTNIALKQRGEGHYTTNVANSYTTAINLIGFNIGDDLWQYNNGNTVRELLPKIKRTSWFKAGDAHGSWSNGLLRYSEFLDYYSSETRPTKQNSCRIIDIFHRKKSYTDSQAVNMPPKSRITAKNNPKITQFKEYLTTVAYKKRGEGHYDSRVASSYSCHISGISKQLNNNLWDCEDGFEIRHLLSKLKNLDWFVKDDSHASLTNAMKRYSEFLDYLQE